MKSKTQLKRIRKVQSVTEYKLSTNDLRVLYEFRPGTGVVTSDIVYHVGSRDEDRGETGIAHMFEHMLFKPTKHDIKRKIDSASMQFEREVGINLNANTWKDRTSYFFVYPKNHFETAIRIEAERIHELVFSEKEFIPERGNVLSEHDMYAGDELFALSVEMHAIAFMSHPYGHETIGHRGDIENYTTEKLERFYRKHYTPNNATLIVIGDIEESEMKRVIVQHFGPVPCTNINVTKQIFKEPEQRGVRTVTVQKPSQKQILGIGVKHPAFPTKEWFETAVVCNLLTDGPNSFLYSAFVDTGIAVSVSASLEPTSEENLAEVHVILTKKYPHTEVEKRVFDYISKITRKDIDAKLQGTIAKMLLEEARTSESSLGMTSNLVEYVSAGVWEDFFNTKQTLSKITSQDVLARMKQLFTKERCTIGYFKGTIL